MKTFRVRRRVVDEWRLLGCTDDSHSGQQKLRCTLKGEGGHLRFARGAFDLQDNPELGPSGLHCHHRKLVPLEWLLPSW